MRLSLELQKCLEKGKIKEFSKGKALVKKELSIAKDDLKEAKAALQRDSFKWATIQSYYSMFHSARALIYAKNFRERSHYCLLLAIREFYVKTKKLSHSLVEAFQLGKTLRENADYYGEWSKEGAKELYAKAEEFLKTAKKLIQ